MGSMLSRRQLQALVIRVARKTTIVAVSAPSAMRVRIEATCAPRPPVDIASILKPRDMPGPGACFVASYPREHGASRVDTALARHIDSHTKDVLTVKAASHD